MNLYKKQLAIFLTLFISFEAFAPILVLADDDGGIADENILLCTPSSQVVNINQTVSFGVSALQGSQDRFYVWNAPGGNPTEQNGQNLNSFQTSFSSPGEYRVTVFSGVFGNDPSSCYVTVTPPGSDDNNTPPPPPPINPSDCAVFDNKEDETKELVAHGWDDLSLQDIFNQKSINKDVIDDQEQYQVLQLPYRNTSFEVEIIGKYSAINSTFGYYRSGATSTFNTPIWRSDDFTGQGPLGTFTIENPSDLSFAISVPLTATNTVFRTSENVLNLDGGDYMVAYRMAPNAFIVAFEDLNLPSSDYDYNDVIVKIIIKGCEPKVFPPPLPTDENDPPIITLLGPNPMNTLENSIFADPGATATDTEDGDLTSAIVKTGSVNTSIIGNYTLTYSVADSDGASTSVNRTVIVNAVNRSNTPPTIHIIGSDPLNVNVSSTFTDPGATATDTEDGDLTSQIVVTGSVNTATTSTSTLVYLVTDSGGLTATTSRLVNVIATTTDDTTDDGGGNGGGGGSGGGGSTVDNGGGGGGGGIGGHRRGIGGVGGNGSSPVGEILGATSCFYLRDFLKRDWDNNALEMFKLQFFLNQYEKETLSLSGVFDEPTFQAVSRFQNKYFTDILEPWGHTAPTGFVYILTKKKINEIFCDTTIILTETEKEEIKNFRAYLLGLRSSGDFGDFSTGSAGTIDFESGNLVSASSIDGEETLELESENEAGTEAESASIFDSENGVLSSSVLRNAAVSLFAVPSNLKELSKYVGIFLIALVAIYALASLFSGGNTRRKHIWQGVLLLVAIVIATLVSYFSIVLPLAVVFLIVLGFLVFGNYNNNHRIIEKSPSAATIIAVPPRSTPTPAPAPSQEPEASYDKSLEELVNDIKKKEEETKETEIKDEESKRGFKGILDN